MGRFIALLNPGAKDASPAYIAFMNDVENWRGVAFKKQMLDKHRAAFNLWNATAQLTEEAIVKERAVTSPFARALDMFFIQAFKSHQSLYLLCVRGFGEDAATIARRLLEIALQVGYLCSEETQREERGKRFLAAFWHNAKDVAKSENIPAESRDWWEAQYEKNKKLLNFGRHGNPSPLVRG